MAGLHSEYDQQGIHRMRWLRVYSAEGVDFVTSDVGIVKCDGRADAFTSWDMGFTRGRSVWVFAKARGVAGNNTRGCTRSQRSWQGGVDTKGQQGHVE